MEAGVDVEYRWQENVELEICPLIRDPWPGFRRRRRASRRAVAAAWNSHDAADIMSAKSQRWHLASLTYVD